MEREIAQRVYETLAIGVLPQYRMPGVSFAFEEGSFCMQRYGDMLAAYGRLCQRLGVIDTDDDVEVIISALLDIQDELCIQMFLYGAEFSEQGTPE